MRDEWNRRRIGAFPILAMIVILIAVAGSVFAIIAGTYRVEEVLAVAGTLTLIALAGLTVLYLITLMLLRWFRRASTDRVIIGYLASIMRQKLPLAQGMTLAANSERGVARRHLEGIARPLAAGFSLAESVRLGWRDCPGLVHSLIIAGERSGQLALAIEQAEQYLIQRSRWNSSVDVPATPYVLLVTLVTGLQITGIMVAVVPKFKEIFKDFGANMPPATLALISICTWFHDTGGALLFAIGVGAFVGGYLSLRPRRVPQPRLTSNFADWVRWRVPGLHRLEWSQGVAAGLRALRLGLHSGLGLPAAARLAAELDVNMEMRWRLAKFAELTERGGGVGEAAKQAGLGELAALALESGVRGRDMDAAIRYAADYHDALISRWWLVFRSLAWPVATLAMGTIVGFVVVGLFWPLVELINETERYIR